MSNIKVGDLIRFIERSSTFYNHPVKVTRVVFCNDVSSCRYLSFNHCPSKYYFSSDEFKLTEDMLVCARNFIKLTDEERFAYYTYGSKGLKEYLEFNRR